MNMICEALDFINANADVYLGWIAWAAGAFEPEYTLQLMDGGGGDVPLLTQCFAGKFAGGVGVTGEAGGVGVSTPAANPNAKIGGGGGGLPPPAPQPQGQGTNAGYGGTGTQRKKGRCVKKSKRDKLFRRKKVKNTSALRERH